MLAPVQITSATRQNLWRLTFIRTLVLAAQAGSVGLAYWLELLPLPWFDNKPTGDLMTTVAEDVGAMERVLIDGVEQGLIATLPALACVAFNGGTAAKIGLKQLGPLADRLTILSLPSSSPAYASLPFAAKAQVWKAIAACLDGA